MSSLNSPQLLQIETFVVGPMPNNLYLLRDDNTKQLVVVDPSVASENALHRVLELTQNGYVLQAIWNTHGHFDHIYDNGLWKAHFSDVPLLMHRDDEWLVERLPDTAAMLAGLPTPQITVPDAWIEDRQTLRVGEFSCDVLLLPGHSPGSVAFYFASQNVCVVGDVLFKGSAGRTDLPGGDRETLMRSLKNLRALPDETRVLPGHGAPTTMGAEKTTNPFLQF